MPTSLSRPPLRLPALPPSTSARPSTPTPPFPHLPCNRTTTGGRRDRPRVRTFIGRSLHFSNGRKNGNSATSPSTQQSHDLHHDQRWRPTLLQGLADCLSTRLVAGFERLRRGM